VPPALACRRLVYQRLERAAGACQRTCRQLCLLLYNQIMARCGTAAGCGGRTPIKAAAADRRPTKWGLFAEPQPLTAQAAATVAIWPLWPGLAAGLWAATTSTRFRTSCARPPWFTCHIDRPWARSGRPAAAISTAPMRFCAGKRGRRPPAVLLCVKHHDLCGWPGSRGHISGPIWRRRRAMNAAASLFG
jgi:hypothetical protein